MFKSFIRSELVLQEEEVVGCGHSDDIFMRVPSRMQDLLVEVQAVHVNLVLLAFAPSAHLEEMAIGKMRSKIGPSSVISAKNTNGNLV